MDQFITLHQRSERRDLPGGPRLKGVWATAKASTLVALGRFAAVWVAASAGCLLAGAAAAAAGPVSTDMAATANPGILPAAALQRGFGARVPLAAAARSAQLRPAELRMGRLSLRPCGQGEAYCGSLLRPFDPSGAVPGNIAIHFEVYPRQDLTQPAVGTLVAVEGGPGFPSTGTRAWYLALYQPLRERRDVVLMDNRGTGRSQAVLCEPMQSSALPTTREITQCGRSLGETAPLYSTAYAADDMAALLDALGVLQIDLYGDSYGTYFSQIFAHRHPARLRSLLLDGAYPVRMIGGESAWYPFYAPTMRSKFNLACARSPGCRDLPGDSIGHIAPALQRLRESPRQVTARDANGTPWTFDADASMLALVMFGATPATATAREVDAAARAYAQGDDAPLLRLMAETLSTQDSGAGQSSERLFSNGLFAAVSCQDVAQIYDMTLPPPLRRLQRDARVAQREQRQPGTYAPFTIAEFRGVPPYYSYLDACVGWPVPSAAHPPGPLIPVDAVLPDVPVLVLSGEFDDITTPAEGAIVASQFPRATHAVLANSFHVNALPTMRDECATRLARRFIEHLDPGDTTCASQVPALRTPPAFVRRVDELRPALALPGNEADAAQLRAVTAAVQTLGDVIARGDANTSGRSIGLRGGHVLIRYGLQAEFALQQVRWTEDLAISGSLSWPFQSGMAEARLSFATPAGEAGELTVRWKEPDVEAQAEASGWIGGRRVRATTPAP